MLSPPELLFNAQRPATRARMLGDLALGLAAVTAVVSSYSRAPKPLRTLALMSTGAIAAIQWAATSSPSHQQQLKLEGALRQHQRRSIDLHLQNDLKQTEVALEIGRNVETLRLIAQQPRAIQPALLRGVGYADIAEQLEGVRASTPIPEPKAAPPEVPETYDLAKDLGENPQSALIVGVPGAGKGMLVANAIRHLRDKHPEVHIMVLDPKADPKEAGYWEGFGAKVCRFKFMGKEPDDCAEWYLDRLEQFANMPSPKLLIGDEGTALIATLTNSSASLKAMGRHRAFISHLASMGDSGQTWYWLMAQSANLKDLGVSGGVRSIFRAIALISPKNKNAAEALLSTDFVPLPEGGKSGVYELMESSEVNRAFYDGKTDCWMPSPKMKNYSGYDRDARTFEATQRP